MNNEFKKQQFFLARDIIDMARDNWHSADTIESLSNICFDLARMLEASGNESVVNWDDIFSDLDHNYMSIKNDPKPDIWTEKIDREYAKIEVALN